MLKNNLLLTNIRNIFLVLLGLTFPLSVFASNIFLLSLCFLVLIEGDFTNKIQKIFSSRWMVSIIILVALYFLSFAIFGVSTDTFWILKRVALLLSLPVLYSINFRERTVNISVFAFLSSMFVASVVAISKNYNIIRLDLDWGWSAFMKYTDHNVFLVASIFLSVFTIFRVKLSVFLRKYEILATC